MEEFHRRKALQKAEEEQDKPQLDALRQQEYLAASEANRARMRKDKAARPAYGLQRP